MAATPSTPQLFGFMLAKRNTPMGTLDTSQPIATAGRRPGRLSATDPSTNTTVRPALARRMFRDVAATVESMKIPEAA